MAPLEIFTPLQDYEGLSTANQQLVNTCKLLRNSSCSIADFIVSRYLYSKCLRKREMILVVSREIFRARKTLDVLKKTCCIARIFPSQHVLSLATILRGHMTSRKTVFRQKSLMGSVAKTMTSVCEEYCMQTFII